MSIFDIGVSVLKRSDNKAPMCSECQQLLKVCKMFWYLLSNYQCQKLSNV